MSAADTPLTSDNDTVSCENGGARPTGGGTPAGRYPATRLHREGAVVSVSRDTQLSIASPAPVSEQWGLFWLRVQQVLNDRGVQLSDDDVTGVVQFLLDGPEVPPLDTITLKQAQAVAAVQVRHASEMREQRLLVSRLQSELQAAQR